MNKPGEKVVGNEIASPKVGEEPKLSLRRERVKNIRVRSGVHTGDPCPGFSKKGP